MTTSRATDLESDGDSAEVAAACVAAESAARASAVTVRQLDVLDELALVRPLIDRIWRNDATNPVVTTDLLRAMTKAGSYVCGAFDDDTLVGVCLGFFAEPGRRSLHSHIAGVTPAVAGRSVGFALKLHQRAWAIQRGAGEISWTYDPLVRRNAYFNIAKLGAEPAEYLTNFYGPLHDEINGTEDTDRILVSWRLDAPEVVAACAGQRQPGSAARARELGASVALDISSVGVPVAGSDTAPTVLVAVPPDIERLRRQDPRTATTWRAALREVLGGVLADGARVRGFDPAGWYIVDRKDEQ